jgi:hypothetical protein
MKPVVPTVDMEALERRKIYAFAGIDLQSSNS